MKGQTFRQFCDGDESVYQLRIGYSDLNFIQLALFGERAQLLKEVEKFISEGEAEIAAAAAHALVHTYHLSVSLDHFDLKCVSSKKQTANYQEFNKLRAARNQRWWDDYVKKAAERKTVAASFSSHVEGVE